MKRYDDGLYECPICKQKFTRDEMGWSYDCHGITYRLLCFNCLEAVYDEKGYDGEYYDESDENIWDED